MAADAGRRVLITGIAGTLAGRLAAQLEADERVAAIVGIDFREPEQALQRTEFVRADLRNPLVAKVVDSAGVDTIVHLAVTASPASAGGRSRMKELNVIGTMQLLGAAQKSARVQRVVLKSTTAVYGSHHADPALFTEDAGSGGPDPHGYTKDAVEIERYARGFARRRPDASLSILRFANFVGPRVRSALTDYFSLPVVPTMLGYDPRLQLCHEDDAVEVLRRAALEDHPGTFNVAGPGIVYLSQAIRMAGKPAVPVPSPLVRATADVVRRTRGIDIAADQLSFLRFGRVGDITRLRRVFGHEPAYSTRAAFADLVASGRIGGVWDASTARRVEHDLHDLLTRRPGAILRGGGR